MWGSAVQPAGPRHQPAFMERVMPEYDSTIRYAPVPNFPGYMAGTDGSVWSCRRGGNGSRLTDNWRCLRMRPKNNGYLVAHLYRNRKQFLCHIHRLVLESFIGACPPGMEACHFPDPSRTNCNLNNLRWNTRQGNHADKRIHGALLQGSQIHFSKLDEDTVRKIRIRYRRGGITYRQLAALYDLHYITIGLAVRGKTWKHVT